MLLLAKKELVLIEVDYYIPNTHLINQFWWQTEDTIPSLPRINKFLNYWRQEIKVPIAHLYVSYSNMPKKDLKW